MASRIVSMIRRIGIDKKVVMLGGVARNPGFIEAMKRELEIKRMSRARKLKLVAQNPAHPTLLASTGKMGGDSPSHPPSSKNVGHISAD